jgi:hypothetical protein
MYRILVDVILKDTTPATFPLVLAADFAGVVEGVGERPRQEGRTPMPSPATASVRKNQSGTDDSLVPRAQSLKAARLTPGALSRFSPTPPTSPPPTMTPSTTCSHVTVDNPKPVRCHFAPAIRRRSRNRLPATPAGPSVTLSQGFADQWRSATLRTGSFTLASDDAAQRQQGQGRLRAFRAEASTSRLNRTAHRMRPRRGASPRKARTREDDRLVLETGSEHRRPAGMGAGGRAPLAPKRC